MLQHTIQNMEIKSQSKYEAYIYSFANIPTGDGDYVNIPKLKKWRKEMDLPVQYRVNSAIIFSHRDDKFYYQGPPASLVPQGMSQLYAYMSIPGDRITKATNAAAMLTAIHPWEDGNGRIARRLYRSYVPEEEISKNLLRKKLVDKLEDWGILFNSVHGELEKVHKIR